MAPARTDDDWSDSDSDDELSQVETAVLLGVPDGAVEAEADRIDAAVSRIGGLPALLPSREPPIESSHCKSCTRPMELLVQMWCPFEDSPMDRALYIWGCARAGCQRKDGSVRAFRGIRTNEAYAQKLAQKRARQEQRERDRAEAERQDKKRKDILGSGNPFAMGAKTGFAPAFGAGFGIGAQIFGEVAPEPAPSTSKEDDKAAPRSQSHEEAENDDHDEDEENDDDDEDQELLTALAATSISDSAWKAAPSYPPLYLSTMSEYVPPEPKPKVPKGALVDGFLDDDDDDKNGKRYKGDGESWAKEAYENSMDVDQVFERFMKRVGYEGEQCVRYELNGTPLPFASDATFDLLWPAPHVEPLPVTKPAFKVVHPQRRTYEGRARVERCRSCGGARVFECQLMPNLINVLRASENTGKDKQGKEGGRKSEKKDAKTVTVTMTDEERRAAVARALKGQDADARGMEWGTCMVFSCEKDCCLEEGGKEAKEAWREEVVLVQWDT